MSDSPANSAVFLFQIHPESADFSPPPPLPTPTRFQPPSLLAWTGTVVQVPGLPAATLAPLRLSQHGSQRDPVKSQVRGGCSSTQMPAVAPTSTRVNTKVLLWPQSPTHSGLLEHLSSVSSSPTIDLFAHLASAMLASLQFLKVAAGVVWPPDLCIACSLSPGCPIARNLPCCRCNDSFLSEAFPATALNIAPLCISSPLPPRHFLTLALSSVWHSVCISIFIACFLLLLKYQRRGGRDAVCLAPCCILSA